MANTSSSSGPCAARCRLSRPHPPILIAGGGEKKTLRLVAQYGDACNVYGPPAVVSAKLAILRGHCEALGRDYDAIEKTTLGTLEFGDGKLSAAGRARAMQGARGAGCATRHLQHAECREITPLEIFGREIIPVVAGF